MPHSLAENFAKYFRFRIARSEQLQKCCFQLRHQVYAEELGWEPIRPNGMETDQVDQSSVHCLLQHIPSGVIAGTVRLVLKRPYDTRELPIESHCSDHFLNDAVRPSDYLASTVAEVSRLAVPSYFRRRSHEDKRPFIYENDEDDNNQPLAEDSRKFPNIALGLYLGAFITCSRLNIPIGFALMEPRLNRRLQQLGFRFQQQSEVMDYRGARAVYSLCVDSIASGLTPEMRDFYNVIADQLKHQPEFIASTSHLQKLIAA
jgi:N-acyl amino acid synthase of PEP-CTERM/exosortase system